MGCAFAVCLERKQKRDKECSVTMNFDTSNSTFTRTGSFRAAPMTERIQDPQEFKPAGAHIIFLAIRHVVFFFFCLFLWSMERKCDHLNRSSNFVVVVDGLQNLRRPSNQWSTHLPLSDRTLRHTCWNVKAPSADCRSSTRARRSSDRCRSASEICPRPSNGSKTL